MAPSCSLTQKPQGNAVKASWALEKDTLLFTPDAAPPLVLPIQSLSGISGDGYEIELHHSQGSFFLARLGADGPTLLETLHRSWPPLRAEALRLAERVIRVSPAMRLRGEDLEPCRLLVYEDVVLAAPEGGDSPAPLSPARFGDIARRGLLLGHAQRLGFIFLDFGKLGTRTSELYDRLIKARAGLSQKGRELLSSQLPRLGQGALASLPGSRPPGRMAPVAELNRACPDFRTAFEDWLARTPRAAEGRALMGSSTDFYLGYREAVIAGDAAPEETQEEPDAETKEPPPAAAGAARDTGEPQPLLWLLAHVGDHWFLEALSEGDHATYRFAGAAEMPGLISQLLCAPEFSKEALYLPLEALAGERAPLATPAKELEFLVALRSRFGGRIIHRGRGRWREGGRPGLLTEGFSESAGSMGILRLPPRMV